MWFRATKIYIYVIAYDIGDTVLYVQLREVLQNSAASYLFLAADSMVFVSAPLVTLIVKNKMNRRPTNHSDTMSAEMVWTRRCPRAT